MIRFGSVCSGIEAASVAWGPLGWKAAWLAEIEPFPCAVLAHHYPDVPNLGDMTLIADLVTAGEVEAPDVLCGGTPCQSFSIAGKRASLQDARGNLSLSFCNLADTIDAKRDIRGEPACVVVWENVPGVLSTKDNAFGCFLGALAGSGDALQPPRKPNGKPDRWPDAGVILGPRRAIAWRILDAQYFGLAQRRRRVFVVASARDGFDPGAVLLEFDGVRRDSAPRREAREGAARGAGGGVGGGSWWDGGQVSQTLDAVLSKGQTMPEKNRFPAVLVPDTAHILRGEGFDASEDGTGRGTPLVPVAFSCKDHAADAADDLSPTLRAMGHAGSHANAGGQVAVAVDCYNGAISGDIAATLGTRGSHSNATGPQMMQAMAVRRLTPRECERLQGFPDGWTMIPWRGKPAELCPDGPRYKAIGNSWAVNVAAWLGARIDAAIRDLNRTQEAQAA